MRGLMQWMHSPHCGENSVTTWSPGPHERDALADPLDDAGALVPEHGRGVSGRVGARRGVEVGVADAARLEPHQHLAGARLGEVDLLDDERRAELLEHRSAHLHGGRVYPVRHPRMSDHAPLDDIVLEAEPPAGGGGHFGRSGPARRRARGAGAPAGRHAPVITREYKDIDLVTLKGRGKRVTEFMTEQGYEADRSFNTTNGHRRLLYYDAPTSRQVDVFVGAFEMCHAIPITERIELHPTAVPAGRAPADQDADRRAERQGSGRHPDDPLPPRGRRGRRRRRRRERGAGRPALRRRLGPLAHDPPERRAHPQRAGRTRASRPSSRPRRRAPRAAVGRGSSRSPSRPSGRCETGSATRCAGTRSPKRSTGSSRAGRRSAHRHRERVDVDLGGARARRRP